MVPELFCYICLLESALLPFPTVLQNPHLESWIFLPTVPLWEGGLLVGQAYVLFPYLWEFHQLDLNSKEIVDLLLTDLKLVFLSHHFQSARGSKDPGD